MLVRINDQELIQENRLFLDNYFLSSSKKVSKIKNIKNLLFGLGPYYLFKKVFLSKCEKKQYISTIKEEEIEKINYVGKKVAIYTAIIGKYDKLLEPKYVSPYCDYFIFTDADIPEDSVWEKRDLPNDEKFNAMNNYEKAKYFKIFPHTLFPEYDVSIWVDGNVELYGELLVFVDRMGENFMAEFEHPTNDCIYDEMLSIVSQGKVKGSIVKKQIKHYKKEGFPKHYGLYENSFIIRRHNNEKCIKLMDYWWGQLTKFSWRDQLSLTYSLWKLDYKIDDIFSLGPCWRWNSRLRQHDHN